MQHYTIAQKRLLLISAACFTGLVAGNLDADSAMVVASQVTGLPLLLAYSEGLEGKASSQQIRLLLEHAIRSLHRSGKMKRDMDSAKHYLDAATASLDQDKDSKLQIETLLLRAQLFFQQANDSAGNTLLAQLASISIGAHDSATLARVWTFQGKRLASGDPTKLFCYQKALGYYHRAHLKEKEIELLWDVVIYNCPGNFDEMATGLREILRLQDSTGFRHSLFAQNIYSFTLQQKYRYIESLTAANSAFDNMRWSGLNAIAGTVYNRIGTSYACLGKIEEGINWYRKAVETGTKETHLFWYKAVLFLGPALAEDMHRPSEALALLDTVMKKSPPLTVWEKLQNCSIRGACYERMAMPQMADQWYTRLLDLANKYPSADPNCEMSADYLKIGQFYVQQHNLSTARRFANLEKKDARSERLSLPLKYSLLFSIDSMEGEYKSALKNRIFYKTCNDAAIAMDQRKQLDAMIVKYAAEKKDEDIRLLKKQRLVQQADIAQNRMAGNFLIVGAAMLVLIILLILSQYRLKQRAAAEMTRKNARLQYLAQEKEWLLNEVNSRVKQNLHTVTCLLEAQAAYLQNDARKAIENSQHRVYAMSLLHQKLYQGQNTGCVEMSVYLPEFIRYLDESFDAHYRIEFQLEIGPVKLGIPQAIPVALIINEAVTNSIKYAFPENGNGVVRISMQQEAGLVSLIIADNGIGFEESDKRPRVQSLGLKLIKGLSEDLNANIEWKNANGTGIYIEFQPEAPAQGSVIPAEFIQIAI